MGSARLPKAGKIRDEEEEVGLRDKIIDFHDTDHHSNQLIN